MSAKTIRRIIYASFILISLDVIGQIGLSLLGFWEMASPLTLFQLLYYGFWKEVGLAFASISTVIAIVYGLVKGGYYRHAAFIALSLVASVVMSLVTGFILYQIVVHNASLTLDDCYAIFTLREDNPAHWQRFLLCEKTVLFATGIGVLYFIITRYQSPKHTIKKTEFDTEKFGSAKFADNNDLKKLGVYEPHNSIMLGKNSEGMLYLPLLNKLTISPPGGGKTTSSSIPVLLSHDGPIFAFDVKGELWAVTARFRTEVLKRKVIAIDPFGITQTPDFQKNKPDSLKTVYRFNPFDFVPTDPLERDRMINSFASSFVINEGHHSSHFDDNAKIVIRGLIDHIMSLPPCQRNLSSLFQLLSDNKDDILSTFILMRESQGRARAAANQVGRVGENELGSILSTSYRQVDWIGDRNVRETFKESNFDLNDFIRGNTDIFIILPVDQTKEHSRIFRMMMSLLMSLIVKTEPSQLPKKKMLFLLEELAQLGACPDVEQCIEVMRARGVVVWTVFQSLKQIREFSKPDLFLSMPIKQIFTNDDLDTMQWVQSIGGKKTVIAKTLSINRGDSQQRLQLLNSQASQGESESVQETATDLISLNEIRELPLDEQFVFYQGSKPIRCQKVRYFEHAIFKGKFDRNPLEDK